MFRFGYTEAAVAYMREIRQKMVDCVSCEH